MEYSEEDVVRLLRIQAKTLQDIGDMLDDVSLQVRKQRQFIARVYREIKKVSDEPETDVSPVKQLPNNVLRFPGEE